jgi:hypothetical protein
MNDEPRVAPGDRRAQQEEIEWLKCWLSDERSAEDLREALSLVTAVS